MAEFPDFGLHCSHEMCHQLDYLPVHCDMCSKPFCASHFSYVTHNCTKSKIKDVRVPVCPQCSQPVPTGKNENAEAKIKAHLENNCEKAKEAIFKRYCTVEKCRKKELLPVTCTLCKMQFCLSHRHSSDHDCKPVVNRRDFVRRGPFFVPRHAVKAH